MIGLACLTGMAGVPAATILRPLQANAAVAVPPGPPILYAAPAVSPQLQNTGIWQAPPILVSGASAYRNGEFIYQDFLYDDHGAKGSNGPGLAPVDPGDRRTNNSFSLTTGTYTYPSDRRYAENAADLVELRLKPLADSTAFRFTLNTMNDPTLLGMSVALGGTAGAAHPFPGGANVSAPADRFVTIHPSGAALVADITDAIGNPVASPAATVSVDPVRRQVELRVPHTAWDPGAGAAVRLAAATGLWDRVGNHYLLPGLRSDSTHPGGATSATPAAFFNVAFRAAEAVPVFGSAGIQQDFTNPAWWREQGQALALAAGDISAFHAEVNFAKLATAQTDDSAIPRTGSIDRILASHFEPAQGVNYASSCYSGDKTCQYQGRLQPYNLYVPNRPAPPAGYGMSLLLHANAANYNEFLASNNQSEFGDRATGSLVLTPQARDPGSSYTGLGAADVFETWADVARLYPLDPSWRTISGYSLGGLGAYKLGEAFPDLFSRAVAIVGTPGGTPNEGVPYTGETAELASLRNLPTMIWDVLPADELNPFPEANAAELDRLGYRYEFLAFPGEHLTSSYNDEYAPAAAFLGISRVESNPPHVTYVYDVSATDALQRPFGDFPDLGLVADHAYWLSGLVLRSGGQGTLDVFSHGFGAGDPPASGTQRSAGVLTGGQLFPALPFLDTYQTWGAAPLSARQDKLDIKAHNVKAVSVDIARAQVDCNVVLDIQSDGPLAVTIAGCGRTVSFRPTSTAAEALPNTGAMPAGVAALLLAVLATVAVTCGLVQRRRQGASGAAECDQLPSTNEGRS
ncbi:MAG: hypothetical protein ACR2MY_04110 [Candidatus Dormibacteria bacterium]